MTDSNNLDRLWNVEDEEETQHDITVKPFDTINLSSDEDILQWKRDIFRVTEQALSDRGAVWLDNLAMYKGDHFATLSKARRNTESAPRRSKAASPHSIGITYELVEQKVSKISGVKVDVKAIPPKDDHAARNSSKLANKVIDYVSYIRNTDLLFEKYKRASTIFGESYLWPHWNPAEGPIEPAFQKILDSKEDPDRVVVAKDAEGNNIYASAVKRQGEVGIKLVYPWQVRSEPEKEYEKSAYVFIEEREYLDTVVAQYGIKDTEKLKFTDEHGEEVTVQEVTKKDGKVPVVHFYHKETPFLCKGRKLTFVGNILVENTIHPNDPSKLPLVRLPDIEIPSELRAISFIENIKGLNRAYDGVTFLMLKAMAQGAHLKWIVAKRSTNVTALADLATVVEYSGNVPPKLEMPNTLTPQMFQFRQALRDEIERTGGVHPVSFGDVPKRLDSALAVQELEEQETKRDQTSIIHYRNAVTATWQRVMDIVSKQYSRSNDRMLMLIGRHGDFSVETVKGSDLAGPFQLRIIGASALPDTLAGKTERIVKLRETFGNTLVPDRQALDTLDIAQPEKYISYATVALRRAESENERMLAGTPIRSPESWEDLVSHWQTHIKAIQSKTFEDVPDDIRRLMLEHIGATELLMWQRTTEITGRGYSAKLQALDGWPRVFKVPNPPAGSPGTEPPQGSQIPLQEGEALAQNTQQGPAIQPETQQGVNGAQQQPPRG